MGQSIYADLLQLAQIPENQSRDLFVAVVAIGLGLSIVYAALTNNERCFQLGSVRLLDDNLGRSYSRFILIGIGSACLLMGVYLVGQSLVRKSDSHSAADSASFPIAGAAAELN